MYYILCVLHAYVIHLLSQTVQYALLNSAFSLWLLHTSTVSVHIQSNIIIIHTSTHKVTQYFVATCKIL